MDEAERIVAPLPHGGEIFMPMQETFFAFQLARLHHKFGTSWKIIHDPQSVLANVSAMLFTSDHGTFHFDKQKGAKNPHANNHAALVV